MPEMQLGMVEAQFAALIWKNEPLTTKALVALCEKELHWKRTTTYTVLKKLCNRGIFITENSMVRSLVSQQEWYAMQSEQFVDKNFHGSLPSFVAAFATRKKPTQEELAQLKQLLDTMEEAL